MFSFITSLLPTSYFLPGWLTLETNPLNSLLQGELLVLQFSLLLNCLGSWCVLLFVLKVQFSVTCRPGVCMWDFCVNLLAESALIFRGEVRKLSFISVHEDKFGVIE